MSSDPSPPEATVPDSVMVLVGWALPGIDRSLRATAPAQA